MCGLTRLQKLIERGVLSAPVRDRAGEYCGFLELRDLVSFVVFLEDRFSFTKYSEIIQFGIKMFDDPLDGIDIICKSADFRHLFLFPKSAMRLFCSVFRGAHVHVCGCTRTQAPSTSCT
jgi:hypothetical protein